MDAWLGPSVLPALRGASRGHPPAARRGGRPRAPRAPATPAAGEGHRRARLCGHEPGRARPVPRGHGRGALRSADRQAGPGRRDRAAGPGPEDQEGQLAGLPHDRHQGQQGAPSDPGGDLLGPARGGPVPPGHPHRPPWFRPLSDRGRSPHIPQLGRRRTVPDDPRRRHQGHRPRNPERPGRRPDRHRAGRGQPRRHGRPHNDYPRGSRRSRPRRTGGTHGQPQIPQHLRRRPPPARRGRKAR